MHNILTTTLCSQGMGTRQLAAHPAQRMMTVRIGLSLHPKSCATWTSFPAQRLAGKNPPAGAGIQAVAFQQAQQLFSSLISLQRLFRKRYQLSKTFIQPIKKAATRAAFLLDQNFRGKCCLPPRRRHIRARSMRHFRRHADALAQRGVWVDGLADVNGVGAHFDGKSNLTNHVARMRADNAAA